MNLLIATSTSPYMELPYTRVSAGGAERSLRTYAEHAAQSHCVTYLSTAHKGFHPVSGTISESVSGVNVVHLRGPSIPGAQKSVAALRERAWMRTVLEVCSDTQADAIITYATIPDTLAAVRAKRALPSLRVVEWMAGRSWELHLQRVPSDAGRVAEAFAGKDLTLFETAALAEYTGVRLAECGLPRLGRVAYVEFASEWTHTAEPTGNRVWSGAHGPVVACIANFKPGSKRQDLLIKAWASVLERVGEATLVLAGDGPLRPACMELAERLGVEHRIEFTGTLGRDKVNTLLHASVLTVLPTEFEGRPQSIIESLCAGIPVVASDIPAVRETLRPLGDALEYCLSGNSVEGFSDAISILLCNAGIRERVMEAVSSYSATAVAVRGDSMRLIDQVIAGEVAVQS